MSIDEEYRLPFVEVALRAKAVMHRAAPHAKPVAGGVEVLQSAAHLVIPPFGALSARANMPA